MGANCGCNATPQSQHEAMMAAAADDRLAEQAYNADIKVCQQKPDVIFKEEPSGAAERQHTVDNEEFGRTSSSKDEASTSTTAGKTDSRESWSFVDRASKHTVEDGNAARKTEQKTALESRQTTEVSADDEGDKRKVDIGRQTTMDKEEAIAKVREEAKAKARAQAEAKVQAEEAQRTAAKLELKRKQQQQKNEVKESAELLRKKSVGGKTGGTQAEKLGR